MILASHHDGGDDDVRALPHSPRWKGGNDQRRGHGLIHDRGRGRDHDHDRGSLRRDGSDHRQNAEFSSGSS